MHDSLSSGLKSHIHNLFYSLRRTKPFRTKKEQEFLFNLFWFRIRAGSLFYFHCRFLILYILCCCCENKCIPCEMQSISMNFLFWLAISISLDGWKWSCVRMSGRHHLVTSFFVHLHSKSDIYNASFFAILNSTQDIFFCTSTQYWRLLKIRGHELASRHMGSAGGFNYLLNFINTLFSVSLFQMVCSRTDKYESRKKHRLVICRKSCDIRAIQHQSNYER